MDLSICLSICLFIHLYICQCVCVRAFVAFLRIVACILSLSLIGAFPVYREKKWTHHQYHRHHHHCLASLPHRLTSVAVSPFLSSSSSSPSSYSSSSFSSSFQSSSFFSSLHFKLFLPCFHVLQLISYFIDFSFVQFNLHFSRSRCVSSYLFFDSHPLKVLVCRVLSPRLMAFVSLASSSSITLSSPSYRSAFSYLCRTSHPLKLPVIVTYLFDFSWLLHRLLSHLPSPSVHFSSLLRR